MTARDTTTRSRAAGDRRQAPARLRRLWRRLVLALAALVALPFVLLTLYGFVPPVSTLMIGRWLTL